MGRFATTLLEFEKCLSNVGRVVGMCTFYDERRLGAVSRRVHVVCSSWESLAGIGACLAGSSNSRTFSNNAASRPRGPDCAVSLATSTATPCRTVCDAFRCSTMARVARESRAFSIDTQSSGLATSFCANDTRRAAHSGTAHGSRPWAASRRPLVSLKSVRRTSADWSGCAHSMMSVDLVRFRVMCM
jgi:hypothetical protein